MAVTLYHIGRTPVQQQFSLDQFAEHYKSDSAADIVVPDAGVPQKGDAHPDFASMFVIDRNFQETADKSCTIDIVYAGTLSGDLPPQKHESSTAIMTASSNTSSLIWPLVADQPVTMQFYAPSNALIFMATSATPTDEPSDPATITTDQLITWAIFGEQPASSIPGMATWLLENAFVQAITETTSAEELVAGQFWRVTKRKVRTLLPYAPAS